MAKLQGIQCGWYENYFFAFQDWAPSAMTDEPLFFQLTAWFNTYVDTFVPTNPVEQEAFAVKKAHTMRVVEEMRRLCDSLNLSGHERDLALICALFHDVGRFAQFRRFGTYTDQRSIDHAALGLSIMREHGVLATLDTSDANLVEQAIGCHNQFQIPTGLGGQTLLHAQLLRDADKLDIWHVVTTHYRSGTKSNAFIVAGGLSAAAEISPIVSGDIFANRVGRYENIRSLLDFKALQMGWVFDLNFEYSIRAVRNRGYIELLRDTLPQTELTNRIYRHIHDWLESRCTG
jgi:putative nucleotidyltransferase with HDIG domain